MSQPPLANSDWLAMRAMHQEELDTFTRKIMADRQEFERRVKVAHSDLLARHIQQEQAFWRQPHPRAPGQNVAPFDAPQAPMLGPAGKQRSTSQSQAPSLGVHGNPWQQERATLSLSTSQHPPQQQLNLSANAQQTRLQSDKQVLNGPTGAQPLLKPSATSSQPRSAQKRKVQIIDLCSDDDDVLIEVTKPTCKRSTAVPSPFRPSIPTATLKLFGENSKKHLPTSDSLPLKRENINIEPSTHGSPPPHLPKLASKNISEPTTKLHPKESTRTVPKSDSAALDALSSIVSQRAATAVPFPHQIQSCSQPACKQTPSSFDNDASIPIAGLARQLQGKSDLKVNHATMPVDNNIFSLLNHNQDSGLVGQLVSDEQKQGLAQSSYDVSVRQDSDGDLDVEDIPLALLNVKAVLKKLGSPTSNDDRKSTHLPSPSRSVTPTPSISKVSETTTLLNSFKKPALPPTNPRDPHTTQTSSSTSRATSRASTVVSSADQLSECQRESSLASRISKISIPSRKRKKIVLSDDEQSDYTPSESSPFTEHKKPTTSLGSPLRKSESTASGVSKARGPLPSSSLFPSPKVKNKNGSGSKAAAPDMPSTPPRTPKFLTPPTSTRTPPNKKPKPSSITPGKRSAAAKAQESIRRMSAADEQFHTDVQIFQASAREARKRGTTTADLGQRLRSMSITPVPMGMHFENALRDCSMPDASIRAASTASKANMVSDLGTKEKHHSHRATGGRAAACGRNINKLICDDSDGEEENNLDTSQFFSVNGIILQAGQEGRLTEEQSKGNALRTR